jgi:hypothetical protein
MKCERCGNTYPSIYYFQEDGRLTPLICTICFDALSKEEKILLREETQKGVDAKVERTHRKAPLIARTLKWTFFSVLGLWLVLLMFVNLTQTEFSQQIAQRGTPLLPVFMGSRFVLLDEQLIDREVGPVESEIRISPAPGGESHMEGKVTFRMGPDGELHPVLWAHGVKHTWIGRHEAQNHVFEGDPSWPLVFRVDKDKGYVYLRGRGTVTTPDGRVFRLPR